MIVRRVAGFFDERLGSDSMLRTALRKIYPDHWSFYLGEFALYCFIVLVATGIWLTFVYQPSTHDAYASVVALGRSQPIGYLMRQVHHWSAVVFVAAIILHMGRIFFTAAYRKPREINWVVGVLMLVLASLTGFTGYSLPNDALSGTGLRIGMSVAQSIPFIGTWASDLVNGGSYPGPFLLPHIYTIHVYFLPVAIGLLIAIHLGLLFLQKHTQFESDGSKVIGRRFYPDYLLRTLAAFGATIAAILVLASLVEINPIERYGEYQDWTVPNPATPDWYAGWLDGALRLGPAFEPRVFGHPIPAVFWPGVVLTLLAFVLVVSWPWIAARFERDDALHDVLVPPSAAPWRVGIGAAFVTAGIVLTLAASDDQQSRAVHVPVTALVTLYRWAFPLGSLAAGVLAASFARQLRRRIDAAGPQAERVVVIRRNERGGFDDEAVKPA